MEGSEVSAGWKEEQARGRTGWAGWAGWAGTEAGLEFGGRAQAACTAPWRDNARAREERGGVGSGEIKYGLVTLRGAADTRGKKIRSAFRTLWSVRTTCH